MMLQLQTGMTLQYQGRRHLVRKVASEDEIVLEDEKGLRAKATLAELSVENSTPPSDNSQLSYSGERLTKASRLADLLAPWIDGEANKAEREEIAQQLGWSVPKVYRQIQAFQRSGDILSLIPKGRSGGKGKSRLPTYLEEMIQDAIDEVLLKKGYGNLRQFKAELVKALATKKDENGNPVEINAGTLRRRIEAIPHDKVYRSSRGRKDTNPPELQTGRKHIATRPMQAVEIDHWFVDVKPRADDASGDLRRAYATIAICTYTKMVVGFHLSLSEPSATTLACAMINMLMPKEIYLREMGMSGERWPGSGVPNEVAVDNAGEFRGNSLNHSAKRFNFNIQFRPAKKAKFGAIIERYNGTLANRLKMIEGSTGSNIRERDELGLHMPAIYTFEGLERRIILEILRYHSLPHTGDGNFGRSPNEMWDEYYFGAAGQKKALPAVFGNEMELRYRWLPLINPKPTLQRYGIQYKYLKYTSPELSKLISDGHLGAKLSVRIAADDAAHLIVEHPEQPEQWFAVYTNAPAAYDRSHRELSAARRAGKKKSRQPSSAETQRFDALIRQEDEEAAAKSATARTKLKQRAQAEKNRKDRATQPNTKMSKSAGGSSGGTRDAYSDGHEDLDFDLPQIDDLDISVDLGPAQTEKRSCN